MDKTQNIKWLLKWALVMATLAPSVLIMQDFQEKEAFTMGGVLGLTIALVLTGMVQAAFDVGAYCTIAKVREKNGEKPLTLRMWKSFTKQSTFTYVLSYGSLSIMASWLNGSLHAYWNWILPALFGVAFIWANWLVYKKAVSLIHAEVAADDESESFLPLSTKE